MDMLKGVIRAFRTKNHSLTLEENDIADQIFFKNYYPDVSPNKGKNSTN